MIDLARHEITIHERPVELLQQLLRFDTSNPPGNERACVAYIERLLRNAGLETRVVARVATRPNLVARLRGTGNTRPLLLHGHVDVMPATDQRWRYPPFGGDIADGCIWGRGALDMKGGLAMLLAAVLRARAEGMTPPGDVVVAILADEEAESEDGAGYLVEHHAELFAGIRYAISEVGGFSLQSLGRRFYPIQVAEKQRCWVRASVRGEGGVRRTHSVVRSELTRFRARVETRRLPVHVTPLARQMIDGISAGMPFPVGGALRLLLRERVTDRLLDAMGRRGAAFDAILHDEVDKRESRIDGNREAPLVELLGRVLPGRTPDEMLEELKVFCENGIELELARADLPPPLEPDMGLYPVLEDILRQVDRDAVPFPLLLARGQTNARFFTRLGIQTYGWIPMRLPSDLKFMQLVHSADERIPLRVVPFGTAAIFEVLRRFGEAP